MESKRTLSVQLFAGLVFSLLALALYASFTWTQLNVLRKLQTGIIDRNRRDSLLLVRIQNDLNALGLGMRDMLDNRDGYALTAWRAQFARIRSDLEDALQKESAVAPASRTPEQSRYLASSMSQFWDALDRTFELAQRDERAARDQVSLSLQARQAALSTTVARFLVQNSDAQEQAFAEAQRIHTQVERNLYLFLAAMLVVLTAAGVWLIGYNRRMFDRVTALSNRRRELAQQLISMQESIFRSISRELHDEFGQVLTAVGAMLQRSSRLAESKPAAIRAELSEVHHIVQSTLEKVRELSQALHPAVLEEAGLEGALDAYVPVFERRTGITVRCTKPEGPLPVSRDQAVHVYRVLQEALNNVARHSGATEAEVRLTAQNGSIVLEVEDSGAGFRDRERDGLGLVSMRERAEMAGGTIEYLEGKSRGALVRLTVPVLREDERAVQR